LFDGMSEKDIIFINNIKNYDSLDINGLKDEFKRVRDEWILYGGTKGTKMLISLCDKLEVDIDNLVVAEVEKQCQKTLYRIITLHMLFVKY
jgi:hypothetical protein